MSKMTHIQLDSNIISRVPLNIYDNDFTFVVNGEIYRTSKIISDLISPIVCKQHINDITMDTFTINTINRGNFQHVLNLVNFQQNSIPDAEIPFFIEIVEFLGITSLDILDHSQSVELTEDNIFDSVKLHERFHTFYRKAFENDIEFISKHFFNLCETHSTDLIELLPSTIERIISNKNLKLNNEDQLVTFLNKLYQSSEKDDENSELNLYEYVMFSNISAEAMISFLNLFDLYDFDRQLWISISKRLTLQVVKTKEELANNRYKNQISLNSSSKVVTPESNETFCGIIKYIRNRSNGDIKSKIDISASSIYNSEFIPENVFIYEDKSKRFESENKPDSWICFEFKENKIIPSHYQIMPCCRQNYSNPRSWVIEGSNDNCNWEILDERTNCSDINEPYKPKIFQISNQCSKEFKFIRMRLTGPTWYDSNYFILCSFELYGILF